MTIHLVTPTAPDAKTALIERIKAMPRLAGTVQCSRCAGNETMTLRTGDRIENGKLKAGQVLHRGICPHCWRRGIIVDLMPPKPKIVKEPKLIKKKLELVQKG